MPTRTRRNTVRHSILTENKTFPGAACRRRGRKDCEKMKIIKNQIHIGVETPFTILHASDTHLWRADERDGEKKMKHAKGRGVLFPRRTKTMNSSYAVQTSLGAWLPTRAT